MIPKNRIIRKRIAARTVAVHLCAVPHEFSLPGVINQLADRSYLHKHEIPRNVPVTDITGEVQTLTRDEAWHIIDVAGEAMENTLPEGKAGNMAEFFSATGQKGYANYGRPTIDYAGFFLDHTRGSTSLGVGPLLIGIDAAAASGLTALGHVARGTSLTHTTVLADITSSGAYEGVSSWIAARVGVAVAAKTLGLAVFLPVSGAGAVPALAGFAVGAAAAIATKRATNVLKDRAVDTICKVAGHAKKRSVGTDEHLFVGSGEVSS